MDEQKNKYCYLNAIKSIYILKRIFDYTTPIKKLNIIRYNNNIKEKLNINLNDYIENQYIVIEIYPYSMKRRRRNKKFINISSEKDESLCHIYFDDDNETEIKRYYLSGHEKVSKIRVTLDKEFKSFYKLFSECKIIRAIKFKYFDDRKIEDMSYMFDKCLFLQKLDLTKFKTNNVTNMEGMFSNCENLVSLDLSSFNTNNVTNMRDMFNGCSSLNDLNLSSFKITSIKKANDMQNMFYNCQHGLKQKIRNNYKIFNEIL